MSAFFANSVNRRLSVPYTGAATTDFTVTLWGKLAGTNASRRAFFSAESNWVVGTFTDGLTISFQNTAGDNLGQVLQIDTWYHIAMTVRSTSTTNHYLRGYINGVLQVDVTDATLFATYSNLVVGNDLIKGGAYKNPLTGNVRDVRVWTRALTPMEIVREMESKVPYTDGLLLWSPLDDDLFTDRSGNGNILTAAGAVTLQGGGSFPTHIGRGMAYIR